MADRDFYTLTDELAYPFLADGSRALAPSGVLPKRGVVDAGFLLGQDSGFVPGQHTVYLYGFRIVSGVNLFLDFRSNAPGLAGYRWLFHADAGTGFGCPVYANAELVAGGPEEPDRGSGFAAFGNLSEILALGASGTWTLVYPLPVEPALLQSLVNTLAKSVSVANDPRRCPQTCTSSSSSAAGGDTAYMFQAGLVGDVKLKEGYNCQILVGTADNSLKLSARRRAGMGEPCEDVRLDEHGFRRGDECEPCARFIRSFNGLVSQTGKVTLVSKEGMVVVPDPVNHRITIKIETNRVCGSSSSSGP
jgi:hypothetical protein